MSSATSPGKDSEVHISRDNQRKINTFAIRNGWMEELSAQLKGKQNDLKNLEDAEGDVMLLDEGQSVPILTGDSYVCFGQEGAQTRIQDLMTTTRSSIKDLEAQIDAVKAEMSSLKSELYGRFGDNINLENDDE